MNDSQKRLQVFVVRADVEPSLHAQFKAKCAIEGLTMSDVVRELVTRWCDDKDSNAQRPATRREGK